MKTGKVFAMLIGALIYIALWILLSGYGNKKTHPDINSAIVDAFEALNNKGNLSMDKFKEYWIFLDIESFRGTGITKEGFFHPDQVPHSDWIDIKKYAAFEEGELILTAKQWISHGGMSADVPEVPASLRHFYDPTKPAGSRYLTDKANSRIMGFMQRLFTNPMIDGVEWAIGKPNTPNEVETHYYNWENGKMWMKMALEESDIEKRKEYMAASWRSLGEALHMIADNGCPSHVRNDAHPSPLFNNNRIFGNPDPYEELVDYIRNSDEKLFKSFFEGMPNSALKSELASCKTIADIGHALAVFTNKNFVTTETISGTDRRGNYKKQIISPDVPYNSPLLDNMDYGDYYYSTNVGNYMVKHCTDLSYFGGFLPHITYPYVDIEAVKSQAAVLMPNIVEAGVNAMKLYIPKLSVEIKSTQKSKVKGRIVHTPDDEYKTEIKYNGPVKITIKDPKFKIKSERYGTAINGEFEGSDISFDEGDIAVAEIAFGGVAVRSKDFECAQALYDFNVIYCSASIKGTVDYKNNGNVRIQDYNLGGSSDYNNDNSVVWSGNNFSCAYDIISDEGNRKYNTQISFSGTINAGSPKTVSGSVSVKYYTIFRETSGWLWYNRILDGDYSYQFNNVPMSSSDDSYMNFRFESTTGSEISKYLTNVSYKEEITIEYDNNVPETEYANNNLIAIDWSLGGKVSIQMKYK